MERVRPVRQRSWLIAIVAAFFVLQAPLCVLACAENSASETVATEHSCHDEGSKSSPAEEPSSHADCGCEPAPEALVFQSSDSEISSIQLHVSPLQLLELNVACEHREALVVRNTDLPPPDILLLKSTLIL